MINANEARELASTLDTEEVRAFLDDVDKEIRKSAIRGDFMCWLYLHPSGMRPSKVLLIKDVLTELGYRVEIKPTALVIHWD